MYTLCMYLNVHALKIKIFKILNILKSYLVVPARALLRLHLLHARGLHGLLGPQQLVVGLFLVCAPKDECWDTFTVT